MRTAEVYLLCGLNRTSYTKELLCFDCPWECEPGFALVRTDYWVFALEECVAAGLEGQSVYY